MITVPGALAEPVPNVPGSARVSFRPWPLLIAVAMIPVLAACSLPRGAAMQSEVLRGTESADSEVQVIEVSRATLAEIGAWPASSALNRTNWPSAGAAQTARLIRAGDLVSLSVWDSQRDSLLTTDEQRFVNIQNIPVAPSGRIFIPYIGEFTISGMTAERARREIQERLEPIVPDGQVQLGVTPGAGNTIDVVTGVARPGRVPLPETSPTILSVLAEAGGISSDLRNPLVRLQRAGVSYSIPAHRLFAEAQFDIQLRGGDRILVEPDRRSYVALGAAGRQQVVYFEREQINALDALSTLGGLSEARADLRGVMVLREYDPAQVRPAGPGPRKPNVVFTFDLTHADGLFAAQRFLIQPDDVVLATESPLPTIAQAAAMLRLARNITR